MRIHWDSDVRSRCPRTEITHVLARYERPVRRAATAAPSHRDRKASPIPSGTYDVFVASMTAILSRFAKNCSGISKRGQPYRSNGAYIEMFPCLPLRECDSDPLFRRLASIVFPATVDPGELSPNERSDLRHVMTAIHHDLAGLITNDSALVSAGPAIKNAYGIQVLSSDAFELPGSPSRSESFETIERGTLTLSSVTTQDESAVRAFLGQRMHLSGSAIAASWLPMETQGRIAFRCAVWSGSSCVWYLSWPALVSSDSATIVRAAVDEQQAQALEATRALLLHLIDQLEGFLAMNACGK